MNKNAIKKYAVWARQELISRVSQKALQYGIVADYKADSNADSINGKILSAVEKKQRQALIRKIQEQGYEQVMEEVAYTWFNRFAALRFMEVNGYLPSHVRIFTNEDGEFKPQILSEAIHLDIEGLNMDKVYELKNSNKSEELFKYLLIIQCNALSNILPGMFQKIEDYTELLLPDNLLREGSVIEQMVNQKDGIPESDWTDQVQIIGWLYQYYNIEQNEIVYDGRFSKDRIPKELLPAATTIYTPDWPIKYMVANSLGRLWLEGHPNEALKSKWKYYLDEVDQKAEVQIQLEVIRKEYASLKPEEIRCIDPCMGSGHILCVLFDTLVQIYESYGYTVQESVASIVENNLWGLDIDERAAQLSYFAVMMKARRYDRRFFIRGIQPHIYAFKESNGLRYDGDYGDLSLNKTQQETLNYLLDVFVDAKEYGSILDVEQRDYDGFLKAWNLIAEQSLNDLYMFGWYMIASDKVTGLANQAKALSQKYHVVVTNPPYLGMARFSSKLDAYVKDNYSDFKNDLSMIMYHHAISRMAVENGYVAFITTSSWMFLSSFEKLRNSVFLHGTIDSLVDFGTELFEGKVGHNPIVAWVTRISKINRLFVGVRLVDYCYSRKDEKEKEFFNKKNHNISSQDDFLKVPGLPIAYWVSERFVSNFANKRIGDIYFSGGRNKTHNNEKYLRYWWEISDRDRWQVYDKGGDFRRWYGNHDYVVDWSEQARQEYESHGGLYNQDFANKPGICWTLITSAKTGFRVKVAKNHYDSGSPVIFNTNYTIDNYVLGFLNSYVAYMYLSLLNPTINMGNTYVLSLPLIIDESFKIRVNELVQNNVDISKTDWDTFETSEDYERSVLVTGNRIRDAFDDWERKSKEYFEKVKMNEEELNWIFIKIYGLEHEASVEIPDREITIRIADNKRDVKGLISYAVGCMFGRYSLDVPGLAYAGGEWDMTKYKTFQPDKDAIIPICDDEYFEDDIVGYFVKFIEVVYGKDTLEENLQFIARVLGGKGATREIIRNYFINDFYSDHVKTYQKRPIYWLFDSGKKNGFKCLVYMHRYQPDTIARIRTDYVHEQQSRYRTAIADLEQRVVGTSASEKVKLDKKLSALRAQTEELRIYEEKIHHLADQMISIDLDDGVKHNYEIFKDVLAKIK